MNKPVFLIPREGVKIREEHGLGHFPAEGDTRMITSYLNRRIKDGDLLVRENSPMPGPAPAVDAKQESKPEGRGTKKNQTQGDK